VHQEQQRAIAHPRQAGAEAAGKALLTVLDLKLLLHLLPLHTERRIGQAVVELLMETNRGTGLPSLMLRVS